VSGKSEFLKKLAERAAKAKDCFKALEKWLERRGSNA